MFGITLSEFFRFVAQVGFAAAGAASLWGYVFSKKTASSTFFRCARLLMWLYFGAISVFFFAWWIGALIFYPSHVLAHEGIMLKPLSEYIVWGFRVNMPIVVSLFVVTIAHAVSFFLSKELWRRRAPTFYLLQFLLLSGISFFALFTGGWSKDQLFFAFHNWHSLLTLGTVLVIDFLFLATMRIPSTKVDVYRFFPTMSKVIWVGLGVDFLSNTLVFDRALYVDAQFLFIQTVIAVIILNGGLLSGRINSVLIQDAGHGANTFACPLVGRVIRISGAVSIVSWLTITFSDFFTFTTHYVQMLSVYLALIAIAYFGHHILQKLINMPRTALPVGSPQR